MKNVIAYAGWLLLIAAFSLYLYGIYNAIELSWGKGPMSQETKYNEVLATTVGSIQALLLTNLGMLLGISIANPGSTVARQLMLTRPSPEQGVTITVPPPLELKEKIQLAGLVVFIISLIVCCIAWIVDDFSSESVDIVSVVSSSGKMFIGVVLAYLTAAFR